MTTEQQKLYTALKKAQDQREALYGNGHFIWHQTDRDGEDVVVTRYEYWARDNRFFRLDTSNVVDGISSGPIRRLISRPEGVTLVKASSPHVPGVVAATSEVCIDGSCGPKPESISGQYFIAHGNRLATLQVKDWIKRWTHGDYELSSFEVLSNTTTKCTLGFTRTVDAGTKRYEVELDPGDFRVLSWTYAFTGRDDGKRATDRSKIEYSQSNLEIPLLERAHAESSSSELNQFECSLASFDLQPAAVEIFDVPNSENVGG